MLQEKLTKRQQTVFNFIRKKIEQDGYGPTIREIAKKMGFASPNGVICHLTAQPLEPDWEELDDSSLVADV